jgi:hypothetical protein
VDPQAVVTEQIAAGAQRVEQFDRFMPVKAAFWLKLADAQSWLLYIAGERVAQEGIAPGNREVVRICQQINSPYLDMF